MNTRTALLLVIILPLLGRAQVAGLNEQWPHWRGPTGNGYAPKGSPPVEWSESNNIKWVLDIPGKGHATPIIWNNQLITVTAVETDTKGEAPAGAAEGQRRSVGSMESHSTDMIHQFIVLAVNPEDGTIIWETVVHEEMPLEATHGLGSWASGSPVTDGERIYAYFGSRGLFCLDMQGNLLWKRDFGQMAKHASFGEGSSAAVHGDRVFVLWDHEGDSFIYALDTKTGKDVWVRARDERTSWSSPRVVEVNGRLQVITSATTAVRAYDYETGDVIWHCTGLTGNVIPYPVVANDVVFVMSGFRGSALFAVDLTRAKGDINGTDAIVWSLDTNTPYTPSPLLWNGYLYFLRANNGILSCVKLDTYEEMYVNERLSGIGTIYTSPVGAGEQIYIVGQKGKMFVVKAGPSFEVLAENQLDDEFCSSPAVLGDMLFLRGYTRLYCIAK